MNNMDSSSLFYNSVGMTDITGLTDQTNKLDYNIDIYNNEAGPKVINTKHSTLVRVILTRVLCFKKGLLSNPLTLI